MGYGFEIRNDNNHLMIDSTYRNHHLVSVMHRNVSYVGIGDLSTPITLPSITTDESVVAVYPNQRDISFVAHTRKEGSRYKLYGYFESGITSYTIYIFNPLSNTQLTDTHGLVVYDGAGRAVFSSQYRCMDVVGFISSPTGISSGTLHNIPSGRKVAVACGSSYHVKVGQGRAIISEGWERQASRYRASGLTISMGVDIYSDNVQTRYSEYLFIDVTDL